MSDVDFFVVTFAAHLRSLPLRDATAALKGALLVCGDHPAMEALRGTFRDLASADDQLELIASPQLKLQLGGSRSAR